LYGEQHALESSLNGTISKVFELQERQAYQEQKVGLIRRLVLLLTLDVQRTRSALDANSADVRPDRSIVCMFFHGASPFGLRCRRS
jgi:hypothetical protein